MPCKVTADEKYYWETRHRRMNDPYYGRPQSEIIDAAVNAIQPHLDGITRIACEAMHRLEEIEGGLEGVSEDALEWFEKHKEFDARRPLTLNGEGSCHE